MGIQNYLKRVSRATKDIKSAIVEKGVPVASCDGIEVLADKVRAIEVGAAIEPNEILYTMLAFKQSTSMPGTPVGGSFTSSRISYPTGWSDGAGLTENVWMSYCVVSAEGAFIKEWVTPIKLSGVSSGTSVDLTDYALKSWVLDQIANITTGGSIDLSKYATIDYVKSYVASQIQNAGVSSLNSMTGDLTLKGSSTVFIERGSDGKSLVFTAKGGDGSGGGNDGDTIRSFNIYKNTDSNVDIPDIPTSSSRLPYWDYTSGELMNCPTGWSTDMTSEPTKYTWMAVAFFSKNSAGAMVGTWEGPFCITGEPGQPGKDGANFEFIYALTPDADHRPNYPTSNADRKALFDAVEQGDSSSTYHVYNGQKWYDRAQSIDSVTNRACWMAQRVKYAGASDWAFYSEPVIWANWGSDGTDGDGVEYIFFLTDDAHQQSGKWYSDAPNFEISYTENGTVNGVSTPYANTVDDWVPKGWTDEPQDVSATDGFYEFCATRKSKDGVWEKFSTPALWAKYAMDGKDGASIEYVFALCSEELDPSLVSVDNEAANKAGAHTTDEYLPMFDFNGTKVQSSDDPESVSETKKYQWVSIRRRKRGENAEWGDFSHPALWNMWSKGSQGPKGEDGDKWEYCYVLSESYIVPSVDEDTPSANSPHIYSYMDGYLPKFIFKTSEGEDSVDTVATEPSVSSEKPYCWASRRRQVTISGETQWDKFQTPYMCRNYVKPGLTEQEIEELKNEVSSQITGSVVETENEIKAIKSRLDNIDETGATFFVDNKDGIIKALTQYKTEEQTSFSDLVLDGSEGKFGAMVGAYMQTEDGKKALGGAGLDLDALEGCAKMYADYQEQDPDGNYRVLSGLRVKLDAIEGKLELGGDYTTQNYVDEKVTTMAKETLDAAKGMIESTAAKGKWVWGVWELEEDADEKKATSPTYVPKGKLLATKLYDLTRFTKYTDEDGVEHPTTEEKSNFFETDFDSEGNVIKSGEEKYRETIQGTMWEGNEEYPPTPARFWTRTIEAKAFSTIVQTAGKIDLTAYGEEGSLAQIVLNATGNDSEIDFMADSFHFKEGSVINASNLVMQNLVVTGGPSEGFEYDPVKDTTNGGSFGASINFANIDRCKITSCRIESAIQSTNYKGHDDTKVNPTERDGVGFLLDGAGTSFALYSSNGGRITPDEIRADKVQSTNYDASNQTGFSLNGDGSYALYGGTGDNVFKLTNDELVIPAALIKGVTATKLTSDSFTTEEHSGDTISTYGNGFNLDSSENTFEFYKPKDGGGYEFKLTQDELLIDSAHITNLTTGDLPDFYESVWSVVGEDTLRLSEAIKNVNAQNADFTVQSLTTETDDGYMLNVGKDANISNSNSLKYIDGYSTDEVHFNSQGTWTQEKYTDTVHVEAGQTLVIPTLRARSWGWHAYDTSQNQKLTITLTNTQNTYSTVILEETKVRSGDGASTVKFTSQWMSLEIPNTGDYYIVYKAQFDHPGNNWSGWSKLKFSYDPFSFEVRTPRSDKPGMYMNAKQFVISSTYAGDASTVGEASLTYDNTKGVTSKGIVLSPTIEKIQVVTTDSEIGDSDNVLYIYLT